MKRELLGEEEELKDDVDDVLGLDEDAEDQEGIIDIMPVKNITDLMSGPTITDKEFYKAM